MANTAQTSSLYKKLIPSVSTFLFNSVPAFMFLMIWTVVLNEFNPILGSIGFFSSLCLSVAFGLWRTVDEYDLDKDYQTPLADRRKRGEIVDTFPVRGRSRAGFPILGSDQFQTTVNRVLDELEQRTPNRYREVLEYLPKAEYDPSIIHIPAHGLSDGRFSLDGSDYGYFRWVFLHEVGHQVEGLNNHNWSQEAANTYANQVIAEIG